MICTTEAPYNNFPAALSLTRESRDMLEKVLPNGNIQLVYSYRPGNRVLHGLQKVRAA
jgi:hypothetical protein